ncbi:MAG TPA: lipid-binding SYLF domain-containing protein [Vicinamibacterales bacterium]|nr:lipid-binding SYLF domain-containing protein [Vicinamibacterales bacterium]
MKILCVTLACVGCWALAVSAEITADEANRLQSAATAIRELRATPDKGIPDDLFKRAECVAVIPGLKKGAFIVGGEFGKGVVSCRSGQGWTAPVFIEMEKGSAGFQIGAEQTDLVLLVMNRKGLDKLLSDKVNLGADASVAGGPVGRNAAASTDAKLTAEILAYSRSKGAFAGIDVSGGSLRADKKANANAYGADATTEDVLKTGKLRAPHAAAGFLRALAEEPHKTAGGQ